MVHPIASFHPQKQLQKPKQTACPVIGFRDVSDQKGRRGALFDRSDAGRRTRPKHRKLRRS
jgi:hypothetical protein